MLSIACSLWYPLKAIRFVADSSLMAFASLLSCMRQSLHSLVRIHHLLHPSLALLLCFRSLPSEPQVGVCNPVLLQATVLQSRHGLMRVWIVPGANHCSHLLHGPYLLLLPLSTLWSVACTSFLASFSSIILSISLFLAPDVLTPDSPPYTVSPISSSRDNRNWHAQYLCTVAGRLGLLAVSLIEGDSIRWWFLSFPWQAMMAADPSRERERASRLEAWRGRLRFRHRRRRRPWLWRFDLWLFVLHVTWRSVGCVKNDRRRKRMTSMLCILHLELEGASAMMGIHPGWLRVVICCFWVSIRVDWVPWKWACIICEWRKGSLSL